MQVIKTLIVKNVVIADEGYNNPAIGDCLLCGSVESLLIYPRDLAWSCIECGEKGDFDNIQIKMKIRLKGKDE